MAFSLLSGCPYSPLLSNTVMDDPAGVIRQEKEIKVMQMGKKIKKSIFVANMTIYLENPRESTKLPRTNKWVW